MPTTYAHYSFGEAIRSRLAGSTRQAVDLHLDLYRLGLHGPDFLFYYKPMSPNKLTVLGHRIHKETGAAFLERAVRIALGIGNAGPASASAGAQEQGGAALQMSGAALAYLLGFACHYLLDSACHPLVRQAQARGLMHNLIETEFDRVLMERDGRDPVSFRPTAHIAAAFASSVSIEQDSDGGAKRSAGVAEVIAPLYEGIAPLSEGITPDEVRAAFRSMRRYLDLFVAPCPLKRVFLLATLRAVGQYEKLQGLLMRPSADPACADSNAALLAAFDNACMEAPSLIEQLARLLQYVPSDPETWFSTDDPFGERFRRDFG